MKLRKRRNTIVDNDSILTWKTRSIEELAFVEDKRLKTRGLPRIESL